MSTIFSRIAAGEIPSYGVAGDDRHYAFLDINPVAQGHVLVIPRQAPDYIFDLDGDDYQALWAFAARVAKALKRAVPCKRVGVAVMGLEVPHVHIHLVPMQSEGDMDFSKKITLSAEQMQAVADSIKKEFEAEN